ncbi:hypothetical protein GQ600_9341 [Phytophthora cactorum]|nr:hypothetical protein GQ600_9341 [Phytophthora cactorum]
MVGRGEREGVAKANSDSDGGDANFVVCGGQIAGESSVERRVMPLNVCGRSSKDISWQAIAEFEREYAESAWDHQSTRCRRRTLKRERLTRTSYRIRVGDYLYVQ